MASCVANLKNVKKRLLFIDDDSIITDMSQMLLSDRFNVDTLNNFTLSGSLVSKGRYDCIFLDIIDEVNSNNRAGIELLKEIQDIDNNVPVIMLSGWAQPSVVYECFSLGVKCFIEKCTDLAETFTLIETVLARILNHEE